MCVESSFVMQGWIENLENMIHVQDDVETEEILLEEEINGNLEIYKVLLN